MKTNKTCLFITTSYPPFPESQTIRNVFFINGLVEAGFSPTVITSAADPGGDELLTKLVHPSVIVARTGRTAYHRLQERVSRISDSAMLKRRLRSLTAVLSGKILAPDVWAGWQSQAVARALETVCTSSPPAVVISSSGSFTAHIAGAQLARRFSVPWIAEYGDPWYLNPLGAKMPWIKAMNYYWEKRALRNCAGMTVTTEETANLYRKWLGLASPEISVLPCGFFRREAGNPQGFGREIKIAYVGSASATNRDLGLFMRILDEALISGNPLGYDSVLFRVIGSCSPLFERSAKLFSRFKTQFSGWVTYTKSISEMNEATALLLIGNKSKSQIPGKVYQYMAAGRPIIYLSQMRCEDPTELLLRQHPGVLRLRLGEPDNANRLRNFLGELEGHRAAASANANSEKFTKTYSWESLGRGFADFVESRLD